MSEFLVRITVRDKGDTSVAELESVPMPAYKARAAIAAARSALDDLQGEMDEAVASATAGMRLGKGRP